VKQILSVILALGAFALMIGAADAADLKALARTNLIVKVTVQEMNEALDKAAAGIETRDGEIFSLNDIKKEGFHRKSVKEVLERAQIELKRGDIIYPEEVKYALIINRGLGLRPGVEKAPHEDDGAGGKDKSPHLPE